MDTMLAKIKHIDNIESERILEVAADLIKEGEVVAFKTETVYGLGCDALNPSAVRKIYEAKGRPSDNPLILHLHDVGKTDENGDLELDIDGTFDLSILEKVAKNIPEEAYKLIEHFWISRNNRVGGKRKIGSPLTIIFEKADDIPYEVTGGRETVAVRVPMDKIARAFIEKCGVPIAAPSANISGSPSPTKAEHVMNDLGGKIPMILDGGACECGIESTIIDMSSYCEKGFAKVLRPGSITKIELAKFVNINNDYEKTEDAIAPGMKYKHYSPNAKVRVLNSRDPKNLAKGICYLAKNSKHKRIGILVSHNKIETFTENLKDDYRIKEKGFKCIGEKFVIISTGSIHNVKAFEKNLFSTLREFDDEGVDLILAECLISNSKSQRSRKEAVLNRLYKAASFDIVHMLGADSILLDTVNAKKLEKYSKILFVCTGNTCRSPMAMVIFKKYMSLVSSKINIEISSAGTSVLGTSRVSRMVKDAIKRDPSYQFDFSEYISRQITPEMLNENTLILTMTNSQKEVLQNMEGVNLENKLYTLKEFAIDDDGDIEDPLGGNYFVYTTCFYEIEECIAVIIERICKYLGV